MAGEGGARRWGPVDNTLTRHPKQELWKGPKKSNPSPSLSPPESKVERRSGEPKADTDR